MDDVLVLAGGRLPGTDDLVDVAIGDGRVVGMRPAGHLGLTGIVDRVDLHGRTLIPGLWDMHVHVTQWALARRRLDLVSTRSAVEACDRVATALDERDEVERDDLLIGRRLRTATWSDEPHRDLLDRVSGPVPVVLQNIDLHTVWCNTAALVRFDRADHPTGVLREQECYRVIAGLPDGTTADRDRAVAAAMDEAARRGVVGVKDYEFGDAVPDWQRRARDRRLAVRVDTTVYPGDLDAAVDRGWPTGTVVPDTDGLVRAGHLKLFVDGALNSGTALCHDATPTLGPAPTPVRTVGGAGLETGEAVDGPGADGALAPSHGHLATPPEALRSAMARAWQHGIAPAVHAIGDLAVTMALDAFDHVGCPGRIEHAQLVTDADLPRFDRPQLVTGVQPAHCTDDRDVTDDRWADRAARAYRFADLVDAGARLEFGSDAPVSPLDPWAAIAAAVTRTADERPAWHPEQALDAATALAASARGRDRVRAGDPADLAVLDEDPTSCDPRQLSGLSAWATMVAGRWTHRTE